MISPPDFLPGIELSRRFYDLAVGPVLSERFPTLRYAAGLIGPGSEVLGLDTPRSRDHHWGPRLLVFLNEADHRSLAHQVQATLAEELPREFLGYPTAFTEPDGNGVRVPAPESTGPIQHMVEVRTVPEFTENRLGFRSLDALDPHAWLALPQQRLLETTGGQVFHDGIGAISDLRERLQYYPRQVWLYILSCQWLKISHEEAFIGRTLELQDRAGCFILTARLLREIMRLVFLMERKYWPYSKWFGTAFKSLRSAAALGPGIDQVASLPPGRDGEKALRDLLTQVAGLHNDLGITQPLTADCRPYHDRPYLVLNSRRFADAVYALVTDPDLRSLKRRIGSIDQAVDDPEALERREFLGAFQEVVAGLRA